MGKTSQKDKNKYRGFIYALPMFIYYHNYTYRTPKCKPWAYIKGELIFRKISEVVYRRPLFGRAYIQDFMVYNNWNIIDVSKHAFCSSFFKYITKIENVRNRNGTNTKWRTLVEIKSHYPTFQDANIMINNNSKT